MTANQNYNENRLGDWFLYGWLGLVIFYCAITIILWITGGNNPLAYILIGEAVPDTLILLTNIAAGAVIVFALLIIAGYKIGYYGFIAAWLAMTLFSLLIGFNIGVLLAAGLAIFVTGALLRPRWSGMK